MQTKPHRKLQILCLFMVSVIQFAYAQAVMQPGAWEMKSKISAENPKTGETKIMNESASKFCLSPAFIAKDPYLTPGIDKAKMEQKKAKCSISDEKHLTDSASWKMSCTTLDGHIVDAFISNKVSAKHVVSEVEQQVERDGKIAKVKILVTSNFIGQCTKDMPEL